MTADSDSDKPTGRIPGWVVALGIVTAVNTFLAFFLWLVWASLVLLWHRFLRWAF